MESWVEMKNLDFCHGYNVPPLFRHLQKWSLTCREAMALSKLVIHYGSWSGLKYFFKLWRNEGGI